MPVPYLAGQQIMAVDKGVGLDGDHVSDRGLGREATTVHLRAHGLDDRADPALNGRNPGRGRAGRRGLSLERGERVPTLVGRLPPLSLL
jgi:hypothetical protein